MKKIILVIGLVLLVPFFAFSQVTAIKWNTNLDYAKKLAATKNQPLVIFFMDNPAGTLSNNVLNSTLSNSLIVDKINSNFVPLLIRGDAVLEREYTVSRIPTLLVLDNYGVEMDRLAGVIGIDQAFAMLESVQINFQNRNTGTSLGGSRSSTIIPSGGVFTYENGVGSFVKVAGDKWQHKTRFYTVDYTQTKEDQRHFYLVSDDKKVHVAVPKTKNTAIWLWQESENRWVSVEEISRIEEEITDATIASN